MEKKSQYALITGATSGIGYELARLFAEHGYNLLLVARSGERLHEVSSELSLMGVDVIPLEKDLFDPAAPAEIRREVTGRSLEVSIVVNNAGQGEAGKFHKIPLARHLEVIQLNISALVSLTRMFLPDMVKKKEGRILNVASVVSKTPDPELAVYAATKAFVLSISEALAVELKDSGVTVTALLPGRTDTDFFYKAHMEDTKEYQEHPLADPAKVAHDGFDALMSGESRIVSGLQNKVTIGMLNAKSDRMNAKALQKNMRPSGKPERKRKKSSEHVASRKERLDIGKKDGDR